MCCSDQLRSLPLADRIGTCGFGLLRAKSRIQDRLERIAPVKLRFKFEMAKYMKTMLP